MCAIVVNFVRFVTRLRILRSGIFVPLSVCPLSPRQGHDSVGLKKNCELCAIGPRAAMS